MLTEGHNWYLTRLDKIATPEETAKFLVALALASRHYDTRVFDIATGLPATMYKDDALRQQLMDKMAGTFQFWYEPEPYEVVVRDVKVDPQAGAALYDFLLHDDGEIADQSLLQQRTIVIDPGHRTTDVALMAGRKAAQGGRSISTVDQGV